MIEPIRPSETAKQNFIVCDIENKQDGTVLAIGTSYRWCGEVKHEVHENWSEWFDRIIELSHKEKRFRTVYAHNGGGWDWLSLLEFLLKDERYRFWKIEGQRVQSKIVVLRVHVSRNDADRKRTRFCLRFADSLYLLRSSLQKLAEKFLGSGKVQLGGEMAWDVYAKDRKRFYQYLERDCEALLLCLEKTLELLREKIAKIDSLGLTIGSTALKVWRTGFLKHEISIPDQRRIREFLREGYRGGRVEVFQYGEFGNVNVYDINSLYPTAMVSIPLPVSNKGDWTDIIRWKLPGCYRVRFSQRNREILPVLLLAGTGSYEGEGVFFTPELALLREIDPHCKIELKEGYTFHEQSTSLFSDYVFGLYSLRRSDAGSAVDLLAKYLLNSLYGKLAQRGEREQYVVFESSNDLREALQNGRKLVELSSDLSTWAESIKTDVAFEHVGIAGMITSQARVLLYRGLLDAGMENVVYCDTDSVHTKGKLSNDLIGNELGQFKLENSGFGVYAGRKLYALRDVAGKEKIRAKGVSVGGRNGFDLRYDDLCRMVSGESIVCTFQQPTTANEVMYGKQSCTFRQRKRTLRMVRK